MKRNLTIQLDEEIVHKAKVLAARRATSVSKLVANGIEQLVETDDRYGRARLIALGQLEQGFHLGGGPLPRRESLYDR